MKRFCVGVVTVGLVVGGLSACGDDNEGQAAAGGRPSEEEFGVARLAECESMNERTMPIFEGVFADGEATLDEWADALSSFIPVLETSMGSASELTPPAAFEEEWSEYLAASEEFLDAQRAGLDSARAGDQKAFDAAEERAQGPVKERLMESSNAMGFGACFS